MQQITSLKTHIKNVDDTVDNLTTGFDNSK